MFSSDNSNNIGCLNKVNAALFENGKNWKTAVVEDTSNCKKFSLHFLNNPYCFDGDEGVLIMMEEGKWIYKSKYSSYSEIYVPKQYLNRRVLPGLVITSGDKEYHFIHKNSVYLVEQDTVIYIVFCPSNDLVGSCYLFSQKQPIL
jgi:hypothetical protein